VMSGRLDAVRAGELLRRQEELQAEARQGIGDLDLLGVLGRAGSVRLIGRYVTGLMVWRDLDLQEWSRGIAGLCRDVTPGEKAGVADEELLDRIVGTTACTWAHSGCRTCEAPEPSRSRLRGR
jgi:hypothetical protein